MDLRTQPRTPARTGTQSRDSHCPLRTVRAGPLPLGAPVPLHPLRRAADQAPEQTDQRLLLRRRGRRIDHRRDRRVQPPVTRPEATTLLYPELLGWRVEPPQGIEPRTYALRERIAAVTPGSVGTCEHPFRLTVHVEHPALQKFAPRVTSRRAP